LDEEELAFSNGTVTWYRPTSFDRVLDLRKEHPGGKIVAGNTELGLIPLEVKVLKVFKIACETSIKT
jgi:xanthine dehydrogenase iron-sulfur cluster and FAD-binding subunit A